MKPITTLGVVLLALTAITTVGAPQAMAERTALCDTDPGAGSEAACATGHTFTHVHETSVSQAKLLTDLLTVECDVLFLGDGSTESGTLAIYGSFTYSNCGSCKVKKKTAPQYSQF